MNHVRDHVCECGRQWLIDDNTPAGTKGIGVDCRCGRPIVNWQAEGESVVRQVWENPVILQGPLRTIRPPEMFPSGTEIHVSTYTTGELRLIYVGERAYFVEEEPLVQGIEGVGCQ